MRPVRAGGRALLASAAMRIGRALLDEIVAHAREEAPNECCGMLAGGDGTATRIYRARNAEASPFRYTIHPQDQIRIMTEIEERGEEVAAIYHSHTRTAPYPSQTDINFAANWPGVEWIIVGLASGEPPQVRSYLIDGAEVREVAVQEATAP